MSVKNSNRFNFWWAIAILFFYILTRYLVYQFFLVETYIDWLVRDLIMNIPRIACFFCIFKILNFSRRRELFSFRIQKFNVILFLMFVILIRPSLSLFFETYSLSMKFVLVSGISSICVAMFEESLFRVLLFDSLKNAIGIGKTIFISSILFMVFHIQAQEIQYFPLLFLLGIIFASLRAEGVPLIWLVIIHAIIDISVPLWLPENKNNWIIVETLIVMVLAGGYFTRTSMLLKRNAFKAD